MKRNHSVVSLVLLVGVLTGFVLNTQQAATQWEHAMFSVERSDETLMGRLVIRWGVAGGEPLELTGPALDVSAAWEELGGEMDCPEITNEEDVLSCAGSHGWEGAGIDFGSVTDSTGVRHTYFLKRPVP